MNSNYTFSDWRNNCWVDLRNHGVQYEAELAKIPSITLPHSPSLYQWAKDGASGLYVSMSTQNLCAIILNVLLFMPSLE